MNQLVNSALLAYYSKTGEGELKRPAKGTGGYPCDRTTQCRELERRELNQVLSGLSAVQPVSARCGGARRKRTTNTIAI